MTALLTADEAARLVVGERLVIVRAGERYDPRQMAGGGGPLVHQFVAPQDWVALTGPCPPERMTPPCARHKLAGFVTDCPCPMPAYWGEWEDGRRIVPLYAAATCQQPSERNDGTLCGSDYEVSLVDVVRHEGDGESTFFHLPICYGHRLALGEHVITYEPCAPVLVGRGSIEVVPVVMSTTRPRGNALVRFYTGEKRCGLLHFEDGVLVPHSIFGPFTLDPLPVPGRDFGIVIDCVEVAT